MGHSQFLKADRRQFITRVLPGCTWMCMGGGPALAQTNSSHSQDRHKFEKALDQEFTAKQIFDFRYKRDFIPTLQLLQQYIGDEKLLELLKRASSERNTQLGRALAERFPDNSLHTFAGPFRKRAGLIMKSSMSYDIVEDTEEAFEIQVTECLTADVFRESDAADLGYACVCHADYALPVAFNPKIEMIRDKTLMEGHDCCNHRYVYG